MMKQIKFGKIPQAMELPDLLEMQKNSFRDFMQLEVEPDKRKLMGKVVGLVYALVSQSVAIVQAPTRDAVLVVKALENKLKESGAAAA